MHKIKILITELNKAQMIQDKYLQYSVNNPGKLSPFNAKKAIKIIKNLDKKRNIFLKAIGRI